MTGVLKIILLELAAGACLPAMALDADWMKQVAPVHDGGIELPDSMGSAIAINFQPTGAGKCAVSGDFVLTAQEVNPVIKALRDNGIEVTALHNHMLNEEPRLFSMHFWGNDQADKLLAGLKLALSRVNVGKSLAACRVS
jgi:hypothetical protein